MISKTGAVAIAAAAAALTSTATFAAGTVPNGQDDISKTTIGTATVPPSTPPPVSGPAVTVPAATAPPVTGAPLPTVPPGAMRLNDDTGRITVIVPDTWIDTTTSPATSNNGGDRQVIVASPDIDAMWDTWTTPGVWLTAVPATADPANWLSQYQFGSVCTAGPSESVSDGRFVGTRRVWQSCGGGTAQIVQFAARSTDGTFGVYAQVQAVTPDDPATAMVLGSLGLVPGATMTPSTVAAGPVTTVGPADQTLVGAAIPADAVRVVDDTGRFTVSVPAGWSDTDTSVHVNDDGSDRPSIFAAPDIDAFFDRWDTAGLSARVLPYVDPATYLGNRPFLSCTDGGLRPIATATHSGLMHTWTECGGTAGRIIELAIAPADLSSTFALLIQLPDADNAPLALALTSFAML